MTNKMENKKEIINKLLEKYEIRDMGSWENINADLIITDPPFGIEFSGKNGNYHRNGDNVVSGYVEWKVNEYGDKVKQLLECIKKNLKENGQALIFSGWNNSNIIHNEIMNFKGLILRGKMYWVYNFAPACKLRPAHNVYEIFWLTKGDNWHFNKRCSTHHCEKGEPNLSTFIFKRDYKMNMPKYPTRLPFKLLQSLLEHFSNNGDLIFDPLGGSGMVGIVAHMLNRDFRLGDLNKNGKIVFEHLADYYLNKNGLTQDKKINWRTESIINKDMFLEFLSKIEEKNENNKIKFEILKIIEIIKNPRKDTLGILNISSNGDTVKVNKDVLIEDLNQIAEAQTIERAKYYINRLKKSLTEIKTSKINDLNLNRWKEYNDILTDSLWILNKRDKSGAHNAEYWGNFIPQIPNQFLKRYTKQGEWVLDAFLGSGTTLIECKRLGRNGIGVELLPEVADLANKNISAEENKFNVITEVINADSTELNFKQELEKRNIKSVQFLIMHPPYWDIIKFSNNKKDLSNAKSVEEFLNLFGKVVDNTYDILDKERYFALVIGDKYSQGEWIPLAFYTMNEVLKRGYILKSIIVKNFEETKGKMNQKELWRYRALVGGFYIFKHEYIFLFKKVKK